MFAFLTCQQRADFRRDAKTTLVQTFVVAPAALAVIALLIGALTALAGLPGNEFAMKFLGDSLSMWGVVQLWVALVLFFPAVLCALSDPAWTRLSMRTFTATLFRLLSHVVNLLESLGRRTTSLTVPTPPGVARFAPRPAPSILSPGFSPGASPQLE